MISMGLTTIWFAFGALVAWVTSLINFPFYLQSGTFFFISVIMLYFTRPIAQKYLKIGSEKTNTAKLIGKQGLVLEQIDNLNSKGQIKVEGQIWSARSEKNENLSKGQKVTIVGISGVKLIVEPYETKKEEV